MAASINNIAATFSSARGFSSPSAGATATPVSSSSSAGGTLSAAFSSAASASAIPVRPISASWNPHSPIRRSQRSNLLGLYGLPGPRPRGVPAVLHSPTITAPATVSVGDRLPDATLSYLDQNDAVRTVSLAELTRGRKAVIMAVPGAFAPHPRKGWWCGGGGGGMSPGVLVRRAGEMREKGGAASAVVACVAVNDVYVMRAWGEQLGAAEVGVLMLSDPDAELARALGLALDMRGGPEGFGVRSEGYCMVAVNGVVRALFRNNHRDGGDVSASAPTAAPAGFDDVLRVL